MADSTADDRVRELERDNARLRRLLNGAGAPGELRHRVRNTLGIVRAIVRRSAGNKETVEDYAAHLEGRIDAVLRVHTAVMNAAPGGLDMHALILDELLVHAAREGEQVEIAGPDLRLDATAAEVFGLAIHELATNAIKFGALSGPDGRIVITWTVSAGGRDDLLLVWSEKTAGPPSRPGGPGFGTDVLRRMLAYQLQADTRLDFEPGGLRCTIRVPLSSRIAIARPEEDTEPLPTTPPAG